MNRTPVNSSNINSIGYDPSSETLEVQFNDGSVYQYFEVAIYDYDGLLNASSKGKYLNQYIKGTYEFERVN